MKAWQDILRIKGFYCRLYKIYIMEKRLDVALKREKEKLRGEKGQKHKAKNYHRKRLWSVC